MQVACMHGAPPNLNLSDPSLQKCPTTAVSSLHAILT